MSDFNSNAVLIAVIGLVGILVTALLSNWDKLFPKKNEIKGKVIGYDPTGDFETELRYYFEVSGARKIMEDSAIQILRSHKISLLKEYPEDAEEFDALFKVAEDEMITVDEAINKLMPVYQKYFSVEELQEQNKFYSTDIMQNMIKKLKALTIEAAPLQVELIEDYQSRVDQILENYSPEHQ